MPNGPDIGLGVTEAESLALSGYLVDSNPDLIRVAGGGGGTAQGVFAGAAGDYWFDVVWLDENDGVSSFELRVDGVLVDSWTGDGGTTAGGDPVTRRIAVDALQGGEQITLVGTIGGREYARIDSLTVSVNDGLPPPPPPEPEPDPAGPDIGLGVTEAESLALSGYLVDFNPDLIRVAGGGGGTAQGVFAGAAGDYWFDVVWLDENDGVSSFELRVDGVLVDSWTGDGGTTAGGDPVTRRIAVDALQGGEQITLVGTIGGREYARIDSLTVSVNDGLPPPPPPPEPEPDPAGPDIGLGVTEAESLALSGYLVDSNPDLIRVAGGGGGTAQGVFAGAAGDYWFDVVWLDENDGVSSFELRVDGVLVDSWTGDGGTTAGGDPVTRRIAVDALQGGEQITLVGTIGGREYARIDSLTVSVNDGLPPPPPPEPEPDPAGPDIGLGVTEAESLALSGYLVDSNPDLIRVAGGGGGTAQGVFAGAAGDYWFDVVWLDENDGVSSFELRVDGVLVDSWTGDGGTTAGGDPVTRRIAVDALQGGEQITLVGTIGGREYARIDSLTVSVNDGLPPPPPPPEPEPDPAGPDIGLGVTEAESLALSGYLVDSNPDLIRVAGGGGGTAQGVFAGAAGDYWFDVVWLDENDGVSSFELRVDGVLVDSWTGDGGTTAGGDPVTRRIAVDALQGGEQITLVGTIGGREYARIDSLTVSVNDGLPPPPPPPPPEPEPAGPDIGLGVTEAESLALSGYLVDSNPDLIRVAGGGGGTAQGVFAGAAGDYWFDVVWLDENDGVSSFELRVDGVLVDSWTGDGGTTAGGDPVTRRIAVDALQGGEQITLVGTIGGREYARIDSLTVSVNDTTPLMAAFDFFAFAGQSNAEGHFFIYDDEPPGPLGREVFEAEILRLTGVDTTTIEAALGGSGSNENADSLKYWWNLSNDAPGPALLDSIATINAVMATGQDLDGIIWAQGEDDMTRIRSRGHDAEVVVAEFKDATIKTFEYFRSEFGDVPIFIQELGEFEDLAIMTLLREAQRDLINTYDYVYLGADTAGLEHHDAIHFNNVAYGEIAEQLAQSAFDVIGDEFLIA